MTRCTPRVVRRRGFTLIELLVVVGIIIVMTALSIPAISKFLDGQSLTQGGRIVQSAFNEARRAAITQRSRNYLVFFRQEDAARPGEFRYGMRRFRERVGYEGEQQLILPGTMFEMGDGSSTSPSPAPAELRIAGMAKTLQIPIFENLPAEDDANVFPNRRPNTRDVAWIEFLRDGTIKYKGGPNNPTDNPPDPEVFDRNTVRDWAQDQFDGLADTVDLSIRESGDHEVDRRCLIDIDQNTGRLNFRVLQVTE